MTARIHILDREDQVKWYADSSWASFIVKMEDDHRTVREWLEEMCQGIVVISGEGRLPPSGGMYHPTEMIFENIRRHQYRIYFELDSDAVLFKLSWKGRHEFE